MNRWKQFFLFLICILLFTGCGNTQDMGNGKKADILEKNYYSKDVKIKNDMKNVEERGYATVLLISGGTDGKRYHFDIGIAKEKKVGEESQTEEISSFECNNFEELNEEYQLVKGKDLSLAHLKVILLEENMELQGNGSMFIQTVKPSMKNSQQYILEELQDVLYDLDKNEEIAKTCPVLQLLDKEAFLDYLEKAEEPVGTYLSNLIETGKRQGREVPWLKDYLKAVREGDEILIYAIEPVSEGWKLRCMERIEGINNSEAY